MLIARVSGALGVVAASVALSGCAYLASLPDDRLVGGWDKNEWVCTQSLAVVGPGQRLIECARPGESLDDGQWTQTLHVRTTMRDPGTPPVESVAESIRADLSRNCRSADVNVISLQTEPQGDLKQSLLLEWFRRGCKDKHRDVYVLGRSLYGRSLIYQIVYQAVGSEAPVEQRAEWIKLLSEATIVFGPEQ